ncbi:MAG TPA: lasso RiPP family leader peptide-containing protein [Acidimicrobiales bacterium]|nr:lasso RiPP family leader peptide-containing protein [Acidimicrobiales bacterium]
MGTTTSFEPAGGASKAIPAAAGYEAPAVTTLGRLEDLTRGFTTRSGSDFWNNCAVS